jgi:glycopeptide antibiotics resistance protein
MNNNIELKKTARLSGLLFFLWIVTGFYGMFFVSPKIFVSGDPVASAENILKHETLFRTSIFSGLITNTLWILLAWVFYHLFRTVNERYSKLLVASVVVQVPVVFVQAGLSIATITTLKGEILKSFDVVQRQDLAMTFIKVNDYCVSALVYSGSSNPSVPEL